MKLMDRVVVALLLVSLFVAVSHGILAAEGGEHRETLAAACGAKDVASSDIIPSKQQLGSAWAVLLNGRGASAMESAISLVESGDSDGDGLSDATEQRLGTDPQSKDTDGDHLEDGWEVNHVVPLRVGLGPVMLSGADPLRKDVYVEVDWMRDATHTHEFTRAAQDRVIDAFNRAPVTNPSGENGIDIHIDTGQMGGGGDEIEHQQLLQVGSGFMQADGVGNEGQGAGIAVGAIDGDPAPDVVLMAYDNPSGPNSFRYRVGWNINRDGNVTTLQNVPNTPWSGTIQVGGVGDEGQGAGCRLIDLDGNAAPELVLMAYDNPSGPNSFRYRVGRDVGTSGAASSWGPIIQVAGVGDEGQGAGVAFGQLDDNPRPDMILMAYDNPSGPNSFRYRIGWNVDRNGVAASWSAPIQVAGAGNEGQGADVDFADLDGNGRPEMILMAYDNPSGANSYRYRIGWNLDRAGVAAEWQPGFVTYPGAGAEGQGAGLAVTNLDGGRTDLLLLAYDNPSGPNSFRVNIAYDIDAVGNGVSYDYYKARFFNPAREGIYHYCIFAHDYWNGGSSSGLSFSARDFIVTLGSWDAQHGTDIDQSGAFMHELGHNLGLDHGGNSGINYKPNYVSIMNYLYSYNMDVDFDGSPDEGLDYSHGTLLPLNENALNESQGLTRFARTEGVGDEGGGADLSMWDLDRNGTPDLLFLADDAPAGPDNLRYKVGYDITARGVPRRWANGYTRMPGFGDATQGVGIDLVDLDGNGEPELLVLGYDNPSGPNTLRYRIGWNVNDRARTSNWSRQFEVAGMGDEGQGAGIAVTNLDANPRPDLIAVVYDNPSGPNSFRYRIGWNLSPGGNVESWGGMIVVPGVGNEGQGAGVALADLDGNGRPEMILMAYDNPSGPNSFRYKVGFNLNASGVASSWSGQQQIAGFGNEGQGAGVLLRDLDGNGRPDMILMAYDNPSGPNSFRFATFPDLSALGRPSQLQPNQRDWNGDGAISGNVQFNVNNDLDGNGNPILGVLTDWDDWGHLQL